MGDYIGRILFSALMLYVNILSFVFKLSALAALAAVPFVVVWAALLR